METLKKKETMLNFQARTYAKNKFVKVTNEAKTLINSNDFLKNIKLDNTNLVKHGYFETQLFNFDEIKEGLIEKYEKEFINDLFNKTKIEEIEKKYKEILEKTEKDNADLEKKLKEAQIQKGVKKFMEKEEKQNIEIDLGLINNPYKVGQGENFENPIQKMFNKVKEENRKKAEEIFTKRALNSIVGGVDFGQGEDKIAEFIVKVEKRNFWERLKYLFTND